MVRLPEPEQRSVLWLDRGSEGHTFYRYCGCCALPTLDIFIEFPMYLRVESQNRGESSGSIKVSEVAAPPLLMPLKCLTMQNKLHLRCSIMHVYSMSMIMFASLASRPLPGPRLVATTISDEFNEVYIYSICFRDQRHSGVVNVNVVKLSDHQHLYKGLILYNNNNSKSWLSSQRYYYSARYIKSIIHFWANLYIASQQNRQLHYVRQTNRTAVENHFMSQCT